MRKQVSCVVQQFTIGPGKQDFYDKWITNETVPTLFILQNTYNVHPQSYELGHLSMSHQLQNVAAKQFQFIKRWFVCGYCPFDFRLYATNGLIRSTIPPRIVGSPCRNRGHVPTRKVFVVGAFKIDVGHGHVVCNGRKMHDLECNYVTMHTKVKFPESTHFFQYC